MPEVVGSRAPVPDPPTSGEPTEPHLPVFDTGRWERDHLMPPAAGPECAVQTISDPPVADPPAAVPGVLSEPILAPARPVAVPGSHQYLKRWTFVLAVAGVWMVAAAVGLGLYYWWFHSLDKTPSVFMVLLYLIACTVGSLLIAMVENKPLMSALAVAVMSAPLASTAAAAALYGAYVFQWIER